MHDETDPRRTLAFRVGELSQSERARTRLTQRQVAQRAGTTQQWVSRVERGITAPTTAALDRLFGALDLQLRIDPEPVGSDLDAEIDKYAVMIVVLIGDRRLPVRPLLDVEREFPDVALLMRRVRARGVGPAPG